MSTDSQLTLSALQSLIDALPLEGANDRWWGPNFDRCYRAYEANTDQMHLIASELAARVVDVIDQRRGSSGPVRLTSLACGDGEMDVLVLEEVRRQRPGVAMDFLGLDISKSLCASARSRLAGAAEQVAVRVQDLTELVPGSLRSADLVYMIHGHYYSADLDGLIRSLFKLREATTSFAFISAPRAPYNKVYAAFWLAGQGREFWHSDFLLPLLDEMNLPVEVTRINATIDFTEAFADGFRSPEACDLLDFMCHVELARCPAALKEAVVTYFESICEGKPEAHWLAHTCDLLWIAPPGEE